MAFNIINIGFAGHFDTPYAERTNYVSDGDNNDIFYYLGTNFGTAAWSNPATNGQVTTTGSLYTAFGSFNSLTDNDLPSGSNQPFVGSDGVNTLEYVSFNFNNCVVSPIRISEYIFSNVNYTWSNRRLEGSQNGSTWTVLATAPNITASNTTWYNHFNNLNVGYFKYLRLGYQSTSNAANSGGYKEIKIYGKLKRTDDNTAGKITPITTVNSLPDFENNTKQDGDIIFWQDNRAILKRELAYRTSKQIMSDTLSLSGFDPNFYILDPNGANRQINLPATSSLVVGQFYRIKNLNTIFTLTVVENAGSGQTATTIDVNSSLAEFYWDGIDWIVLKV